MTVSRAAAFNVAPHFSEAITEGERKPKINPGKYAVFIVAAATIPAFDPFIGIGPNVCAGCLAVD